MSAAVDTMPSNSVELDQFEPGQQLPPTDEENSRPPSPSLPPMQRSSRSDLGLVFQEVDAATLEPVDRGRGAWTFIACAFVLELVLWGPLYSTGVLQTHLLQVFPEESPVKLSAINTTLVAFGYLSAPLLTPFLQHYRYYIRAIGIGGILLSATSMLLASFVHQVLPLIVLAGVLPGIGMGVSFSPILFIIPEWFQDRRGLAMGIVFAASGLGGLIFPFLFQATLGSLGLAWTYRIWGLCLLILGIPSLYLMRPRLPVRRPGSIFHSKAFRLKGLAFVTSPLFIVNAAIVTVLSAGQLSVTLYIPSYILAAGMSPTTATAGVAILNASMTVGKVLVGYACDRFSYSLVTIVVGLVSALAAFLLLGFSTHIVAITAFIVLLGLTAGGYTAVSGVSGGEVARQRNVPTGTIMMAYTLLMGIASLMGPLVSAALIDAGRATPGAATHKAVFGSYGYLPLIIWVGSCMALAFVLGVVLHVLRRSIVFSATSA